MKVLVTGANGQLGRALVSALPTGVEVLALDRATLDLAQLESIEPVVRAFRPDVVINAAAYTAVDQAETDREAAFRVNGEAVGEMARVCAVLGARLLHVSTDYVFDGLQSRPYRADDATAPLNVYGESKLAGERAVTATAGLQWAIVRTAWVYGAHGRNFLRTMLRLFAAGRSPTVVDDQIGTPTHARSLAHALWTVAADPGFAGVQHYTDAGVASWYDFAVAILEEARALALVSADVSVVPIPSARYPTPARRAPYAVLDKTDTWARLGGPPAHWRAELRRALTEIPA
jgi:dTDP-4-dehydrorhamnose reductase